METSEAITRRSASNLALAFILLPKEKRQAMSALYAFCREVDDVADEDTVPVEKRQRALAEWREDIRRACDGEAPQMPVNQELQPVIKRFGMPFAHFDQLIRGVEMDLTIKRYSTYADLEQYCYRVASIVGLLSIEIFGYKNLRCREYAVQLGQALQLTNILRDVRTDAERGRIYLPQEELRRCRVSEEQILANEYDDNFRRLAENVAARARHYYQQAREFLPAEDRRAMVAAELMGSVYWRLLQKLEARQFNVLGAELTKVSKPQKIFLILRTWYRFAAGVATPNYGIS